MSTRESEIFRNNIINLGITSISAESKTTPGGYSVDTELLEQFEISDERSTEEIKQMIQSEEYEVVLKRLEKELFFFRLKFVTYDRCYA